MKLQKKTFAQVCILCLFRPACVFDLAGPFTDRGAKGWVEWGMKEWVWAQSDDTTEEQKMDGVKDEGMRDEGVSVSGLW